MRRATQKPASFEETQQSLPPCYLRLLLSAQCIVRRTPKQHVPVLHYARTGTPGNRDKWTQSGLQLALVGVVEKKVDSLGTPFPSHAEMPPAAPVAREKGAHGKRACWIGTRPSCISRWRWGVAT
jgi:hypothetical protein